MSANTLFEPALMPHLIIDGLNRYNDRPCLFLGDEMQTYKEVREKTSQLIQALNSKGIGKGSRTAIISANRPEVLHNIAAGSIAGVCATALHPLGSLDDHAYVIENAGIETLIYDPTAFDGRPRP